ncbi:hypothetical protein ACLOJK_004803 [Asimina triloba]
MARSGITMTARWRGWAAAARADCVGTGQQTPNNPSRRPSSYLIQIRHPVTTPSAAPIAICPDSASTCISHPTLLVLCPAARIAAPKSQRAASIIFIRSSMDDHHRQMPK